MSDVKTSQTTIQAAEAGDPQAQCELAMMYEHGIGVQQDNDKAVQWYTAAADTGNGFAALKLSALYESQALGAVDMHKAVAWLKRASECGLAEAQLKIASILENGKGVEANLAEASKYYLQAAEQGSSEARYKLGLFYQQGLGVKKDLKAAIEHYTKAAQAGNINAQYNLGLMYATADGVQKNIPEATRLFNLAAEGGHKEAKRTLSGEARIAAAEQAEKPKTEKAAEDAANAKFDAREFFTSSFQQSLVVSVVIGILCLTPLGDFLTSVIKTVGMVFSVIAVVLVIVVGMGALQFFGKKESRGPVPWFKIVSIMVVAAVAIGFVCALCFTGIKVADPSTDQGNSTKDKPAPEYKNMLPEKQN